jgi:hypothetical protein
MADKDFGGVFQLRSSRGYTMSIRGTANFMGAKGTSEGLTNQDGSLDRVVTPVSPRLEVTSVDRGEVSHDYLTNGTREDLTLTEEKTGAIYNLSDGFWQGDPSANRLNGELTGLTFIASFARRIG